VDTTISQTLDTSIRGAVGLGVANLDTQLNSIYGVAGDVKSQTDKLQFDGSSYVKTDPQTLANSGDFNATQKTSITTAATSATPTVTVGGYATHKNPLYDISGGAVALTINNDGSVNATVNPAEVWNADASLYDAPGSMGQKLNAAGSAADPLTNDVPGDYHEGQAGYVIGNMAAEVAAAIGSNTVVYTGPVSPVGSILTLIRGDDYMSADSRAIAFSISGSFPSWAGATANIELQTGPTIETVVGVIEATTGTPRGVHFDVTTTTTTALSGQNGKFQVVIVMSNGDRITVTQGVLKMIGIDLPTS